MTSTPGFLVTDGGSPRSLTDSDIPIIPGAMRTAIAPTIARLLPLGAPAAKAVAAGVTMSAAAGRARLNLGPNISIPGPSTPLVGASTPNQSTVICAKTAGAIGNQCTFATVADNEAYKASLALGTKAAGHLNTVVQAKTAGTGGNSVTVACIGDSAHALKAYLDLSAFGTFTFNTVVQAKTAGTGGNSITVACTGDAVLPVHSSLDLGLLAGGNLGTKVEAIVGGVPGDSLRIEVVGDATGAVTIEELGGSLVIVHYKSTVSTVLQVEAGIALSSLIRVKTPGTPATVLTAVTDNIPVTPLAGGVAGAGASVTEVVNAVNIHYMSGLSTVAQLEAAIATSTKIEVKTAGTGANILTAPASSFTAQALNHGAAAVGVTIGEVGNAVTIHYESGVSTVALIETAIGALSSKIEVKTIGTAVTVLTATGDNFTAAALTGGRASKGVTLTETTTYSSAGVPTYATVVHFDPGVSTGANVETALGSATFLEVMTAFAEAVALTLANNTIAVQSLAGGSDTVVMTGLVSPVFPRGIEAVFDASWDGGNLLITGTNQFDEVFTETIVAVAGSTVAGLKVFKTITQVKKTLVGIRVETGVLLQTTDVLGLPVRILNNTVIVFVNGTGALPTAVSVLNASVTPATAPDASRVFAVLANT